MVQVWQDHQVQKFDARATLAKRRADVAEMFDGVAGRYDLMNDLMTGGLQRAWRRELERSIAPGPGQRILDLAAGTGTSSRRLADSGALVIPADLSFNMLAEGRKRQPDLPFVNADALQLPFADDTFDAVTISYGLRNVEDTAAALSEMRRVTAPGGKIVIAEFSTPPGPRSARSTGSGSWRPCRRWRVRSRRTRAPTITWPSRSSPGRTRKSWPAC
jgi:demethylmenaquinone methyltransferase/2-methoxy-6-polyprenyl-1,4-benzoquinol methylase